MANSQPPESPGQQHSSHGVFTNAYCEMLIALFLVMLVVIMLLDSLALQQRRRLEQPPIESTTSSADNPTPTSGPTQSEPEPQVRGPALLKQTLQRIFPQSEITISTLDSSMEVGLAEDSMFDPGTSRLKSIEQTLDRVMTMLLGRNIGRVVLNAYFCTSPSADLDLAARQGQALVDALAARGVAHDALYIGLRVCEGDRLFLQFKVVSMEGRG